MWGIRGLCREAKVLIHQGSDLVPGTERRPQPWKNVAECLVRKGLANGPITPSRPSTFSDARDATGTAQSSIRIQNLQPNQSVPYVSAIGRDVLCVFNVEKESSKTQERGWAMAKDSWRGRKLESRTSTGTGHKQREGGLFDCPTRGAGKQRPGASELVDLEGVKDLEAVCHHIHFCVQARVLDSLSVFVSAELKLRKGERTMVIHPGPERSRVIGQIPYIWILRAFGVCFFVFIFSTFDFGVLRVNQRSWKPFWVCHHMDCPEKTGWADSGGRAPSPGKSLGAVRSNQPGSGCNASCSVRKDARGSCCLTHTVFYRKHPFSVSMQMTPFLYQFQNEIEYTQFVSNESSLHLGFIFTLLLTDLALSSHIIKTHQMNKWITA